MSKYFTDRFSELIPYVPGEQPQDMQYVKLNTNESPFPPSESVYSAVFEESKKLRLYSDPESFLLRKQMSENYGLPVECIMMANGSDEALNYAVMAFADEKTPLAFADTTYGFYPVIAQLNHIPYVEIPLRDDFTLSAEDYFGIGKTIIIANPNAPTGKYLELSEIEKIVASNPDNIVIIDEAYIDFGGESAYTLVPKYDNLLVVGTFSKSRSLAGARLGFVFGNSELIKDLNTLRYSENPYNVSRINSAAGIAALKDQAYYDANCRIIMENRAWTAEKLVSLGFDIIPSMANFIFAKNDKIDGEKLYLSLKKKGVLIRHFSKEKIKDYIRITIGRKEQMETFIEKVIEVLEENAK